jgi:hypothetical protein
MKETLFGDIIDSRKRLDMEVGRYNELNSLRKKTMNIPV